MNFVREPNAASTPTSDPPSIERGVAEPESPQPKPAQALAERTLGLTEHALRVAFNDVEENHVTLRDLVLERLANLSV